MEEDTNWNGIDVQVDVYRGCMRWGAASNGNDCDAYAHLVTATTPTHFCPRWTAYSQPLDPVVMSGQILV